MRNGTGAPTVTVSGPVTRRENGGPQTRPPQPAGGDGGAPPTSMASAAAGVAGAGGGAGAAGEGGSPGGAGGGGGAGAAGSPAPGCVAICPTPPVPDPDGLESVPAPGVGSVSSSGW